MAKILAIDDSKDCRDLLSEVLGSEHDVYIVKDWDQAFPYIFEKSLDLILIDIKMPGFKGDEMAEMLNKEIINRKFKIVLFSAMDKIELKQKSRKVGADGCIAKTFDPKLLRLYVSKFLPDKN